MNNTVYVIAELRVDAQRSLSHADLAAEFGLSVADIDTDRPIQPVPGAPGIVSAGLTQAASIRVQGNHPQTIRTTPDFYLK